MGAPEWARRPGSERANASAGSEWSKLTPRFTDSSSHRRGVRPISVTIITKDEADRLTAALRSVAWADEIVVLDSRSRDGTADLARAAAASSVAGWDGSSRGGRQKG